VVVEPEDLPRAGEQVMLTIAEAGHASGVTPVQDELFAGLGQPPGDQALGEAYALGARFHPGTGLSQAIEDTGVLHVQTDLSEDIQRSLVDDGDIFIR
jgi:hypothetical protein